MKRILCVLSFVVATLCVSAIPVKKSGWKTIRLDNGMEVKAMFKGDEYLHYMEAEDGKKYVYDERIDAFRQVDINAMATRAKQNRRMANSRRLARKRITLGGKHVPYKGAKKALLLLVEFTDEKFQDSHTNELYQQIANTRNFQHELGFKGSVRDYFYDQSGKSFDLTFDVVGPIQLKKEYGYYGANNADGYDLRPDEMVQEACMAANEKVNFNDYDWDGNGVVDALFVLYAGPGENSKDGKDSKRIWPHQSELSATNFSFKLDNVTIDSYACGPEMASPTEIDGIGTICHELSHVFGLPDMYDTSRNDNYGMLTWDIMDHGSYNGDGFVPAAYTSYERAYCGWLEPIELTRDMSVENMQPLSEGGNAYIIYNDDNKNEYYLLENRQKTGWDAELGGAGLLVLHVDFDATAWAENVVNVDVNHQRCTIFHADNSDEYLTRWGGFSTAEIAGDPYPYMGNDSLTPTSKPKAILYNKNKQGTYLMNKSVTGITQNADQTISFKFKVGNSSSTNVTEPLSDGILFHESFDQCAGTGGNDGVFSGRVASSKEGFVTDVAGWDIPSGAAYAGDKCAKFGSSRADVTVFSPSFDAQGTDTLVFVAAPFGNDGNTIDVYINDVLLDVFTLERGKWTTVRVPFTGNGPSVIQFVPDKRFFLDDVKVLGPVKQTSGIAVVEPASARLQSGRIYNLNGQYVGNDIRVLPQGIYILDGKKILK